MKLADYLIEKGISAAEFARRIGRSEGMISRLAAGTTWVSRDTAKRIAQETGGLVTSNDFLSTEAAE